MPENQPPQSNAIPASEAFGSVPQGSEAFGNVPNDSETFRTVPKDAESFPTLPQSAERKENHILTVREVARMFEAAGVARTERSIVNWCHRDALGTARLDSFFDQNDRKHYITPESVERAIQEEKAKAAKNNVPSEPVSEVPKATAETRKAEDAGETSDQTEKFQKEVLDLKILNKGKDFLIEQLRQERDGFFTQLLDASRKVGELETKLLQLEAPEGRNAGGQVGPQSGFIDE